MWASSYKHGSVTRPLRYFTVFADFFKSISFKKSISPVTGYRKGEEKNMIAHGKIGRRKARSNDENDGVFDIIAVYKRVIYFTQFTWHAGPVGPMLQLDSVLFKVLH